MKDIKDLKKHSINKTVEQMELKLKELIISTILFGSIILITLLSIKERKLAKIKTDKSFEKLWNKYEWKTKRLRVYTDIMYKTD